MSSGNDKKKQKKVKPGSFQGLGLSQPVFKAVMRMGYNMPTPIQRKTIPTIMEGQDVVAMARTGSGKTAAFLIPICERLGTHSVAVGVRAVVLSPTRELSMQTATFFRQLAKYSGLRCCLLVGGQGMEIQFEHLANNPDVIIATPGRLMHHMLEADLSLSRTEVLVFDEADRLFELGFAEQLQKIMEATPVSRQTLLFSATLPSELLAFSRSGIKDPMFVRLDVETTLSNDLDLWYLYVRKEEKIAAAVSVLRRLNQGRKQTLMFVATKHHVEFFGELLTAMGLSVAVVYGAMDQDARVEQVWRFRTKKATIMVTTDVAARGIDIPLLDHVLNFDFPPSAKLFVHRSGRTARAGKSGLAVSLVTLDDLPYTVELMLFLGHKLTVPGKHEADDETDHRRGILGAVPPLYHEVETLSRLLSDDGSVLSSLHKSMMVSYGLYNKTRPSASKQSVARAKVLLEECGGPARLQALTHPAFLEDAMHGYTNASAPDATGTEQDFIQELRGFRPRMEKVGNVISTTAMRVMGQAKADASTVAQARAEFSREGALESVLHPKKRKRARTPAAKAPVVDKARLSKKQRKLVRKGEPVPAAKKEGSQGKREELSKWDVKVDGKALGDRPVQPGAEKLESFYLSTERGAGEEAKERGLDMEQYRMDLMPDDERNIKKSKERDPLGREEEEILARHGHCGWQGGEEVEDQREWQES
mmetsp:Transcript_29760/g.64853  ORF Transcript_29760/g.64853 Transcript_29760/m.64853 type:complete len:704 (-) Transcript_29760:621-2732(-)